jgi:hypothetical protein
MAADEQWDQQFTSEPPVRPVDELSYTILLLAGPAKQAVPGPITYHQPTEHSVEHPIHHPRHCSPNQSSHLPTSCCQGRREGTKINTMQPAALRSADVDQSIQQNEDQR